MGFRQPFVVDRLPQFAGTMVIVSATEVAETEANRDPEVKKVTRELPEVTAKD